MTRRIRHYARVAHVIMMMLAINITTVFGQEEAAESSGVDGITIALIGIGVLVVLGLGAAMGVQAKEEQDS